MISKIGLKLTASYILIILVATLILGFSFAGSARRFLFSEKQRELVRKGEQLGQTIFELYNGETSPQTVEKILEVTGKHLEARILVLDARGRRLAMTPGISRRVAYLSRVDFLRVISGKTITRQGYNAILDVEAIFVGTPVLTKNGQIAGAVFLIAPITVMGRLIKGLWQLVALAALIGTIFSLLLALYLSRSISAPIIKLKAAANTMANGDFQIRVKPRADELGDLGKAFNQMAAQLGKSMDALRREKTKIERMLADLAEGVLAVTDDGKLMFINNKAWELLTLTIPAAQIGEKHPPVHGEAVDQAPAWSLMEAVPPLRALITSVTAEKKAKSAEINLRAKITIIAHASPLLDGEELWGIIVVFQDISDLRRVELMRKQLIADLSHELRAPLTIIRSQTEALLDGVIEEETEQQKYLRDILAETVRLSEMIRDLLDIAHLDRGIQALNKHDFCLKSLITSLADKYQSVADKKQISLTTDLQTNKDKLIIAADQARIEQVVRNFLDNALRYTPLGGQVLLRLIEQETNVSMEIVDTGPGIPPMDQPLIWERFYKVNKARTAGEGGVGLGLAIAKEIVEAHGGRVWLISEAGKGATFGFSLPKT